MHCKGWMLSFCITNISLTLIAAALGAPVGTHLGITAVWATTLAATLVIMDQKLIARCGGAHSPPCSGAPHGRGETHRMARSHTAQTRLGAC